MKAPASRAGRHDRLIELQCPECTGAVRVARDELVDGAALECRHCGITAELRRDFDTFAHKEQWLLVDPLASDDEEAARRV